MSERIDVSGAVQVPQVRHLQLVQRRLRARGMSQERLTLLAGGGEVPPPGAMALRQVCAVVHQMTAELLSFTAERIQIRCDLRRAQCHARQIAMYVCHVTLRLPQGDVGHAYGRDRTTVRHACAVVEDRRDDPAYDDFVAAVERLAVSVFDPAEGDFDDER